MVGTDTGIPRSANDCVSIPSFQLDFLLSAVHSNGHCNSNKLSLSIIDNGNEMWGGKFHYLFNRNKKTLYSRKRTSELSEDGVWRNSSRKEGEGGRGEEEVGLGGGSVREAGVAGVSICRPPPPPCHSLSLRTAFLRVWNGLPLSLFHAHSLL